MIEYNKHIIKKFYEPDYKKLLHRPLHRVPVYYIMKRRLEAYSRGFERLSFNLNKTFQLLLW